MPTYDYECKACGKTFEFFQGINEARKKKCPSCGKQKLSRLIGAGAGFIFKGSGFYITDYRSADYKEQAKAESGGPPKESKDSGKDSGKESGKESGKDSGGKSEASPAPSKESPPKEGGSKSKGSTKKKD